MPIAVDNPLPSDCRFREDLVHLKVIVLSCVSSSARHQSLLPPVLPILTLFQKGDMEGAHEWKIKLENKQRRDARLRLEARGSSH
jgi:hypothetical protein